MVYRYGLLLTQDTWTCTLTIKPEYCSLCVQCGQLCTCIIGNNIGIQIYSEYLHGGSMDLSYSVNFKMMSTLKFAFPID